MGEGGPPTGEEGERLFFLISLSGVYDILVASGGEPAKNVREEEIDLIKFLIVYLFIIQVGSYDNSGSFGELALMYNTPRAATIICREDGVLWALVHKSFFYTT